MEMLQSMLNSKALKYVTHIEVISFKYFWFHKFLLVCWDSFSLHTCEHWFKKCMDNNGSESLKFCQGILVSVNTYLCKQLKCQFKLQVASQISKYTVSIWPQIN